MADRRAASILASLALLALPGAALPQPGTALCGGGFHRPGDPMPDRSPRSDCEKACHAACERHRRTSQGRMLRP